MDLAVMGPLTEYSLASREAFLAGDHTTVCAIRWTGFDDEERTVAYPEGITLADYADPAVPVRPARLRGERRHGQLVPGLRRSARFAAGAVVPGHPDRRGGVDRHGEPRRPLGAGLHRARRGLRRSRRTGVPGAARGRLGGLVEHLHRQLRLGRLRRHGRSRTPATTSPATSTHPTTRTSSSATRSAARPSSRPDDRPARRRVPGQPRPPVRHRLPHARHRRRRRGRAAGCLAALAGHRPGCRARARRIPLDDRHAPLPHRARLGARAPRGVRRARGCPSRSSPVAIGRRPATRGACRARRVALARRAAAARAALARRTCRLRAARGVRLPVPAGRGGARDLGGERPPARESRTAAPRPRARRGRVAARSTTGCSARSSPQHSPAISRHSRRCSPSDVQSVSDGGGVVSAARRIVGGRDKVAPLILGLAGEVRRGHHLGTGRGERRGRRCSASPTARRACCSRSMSRPTACAASSWCSTRTSWARSRRSRRLSHPEDLRSRSW